MGEGTGEPSCGLRFETRGSRWLGKFLQSKFFREKYAVLVVRAYRMVGYGVGLRFQVIVNEKVFNTFFYKAKSYSMHYIVKGTQPF